MGFYKNQMEPQPDIFPIQINTSHFMRFLLNGLKNNPFYQ